MPKDFMGSLTSDTILYKRTGAVRRCLKGGWTEEEDKRLEYAVKKYGEKNWKCIADHVSSRTNVQCLSRWQKVLSPHIVKGAWTKEEDDLVKELVVRQGLKAWSKIAAQLPGRIGNQCRERWYKYLNPEINKTAWTREEELVLIKAQCIYGNKWAKVMKLLPGRTENFIKSHWNSLKKKLDLNLQSTTAPHCDRLTTLELLDSTSDIEKSPKLLKPSLVSSLSADKTFSSERSMETSMSSGRSAVTSTTTYCCQQMFRSPNTKNSDPRSASLLNSAYKAGNQIHKFCNDFEREGKSWGGLCYQSLTLADLKIFLETGSFPHTYLSAAHKY